MPEDHHDLFEKLSRQPLFQGMSRSDWAYVSGHTRFVFERYDIGEKPIAAGAPCHLLRFLLKGQVATDRHGADGTYRISETCAAPHVFEPENLFGLSQCHAIDVTTLTPCEMLALSKTEVTRLSSHFDIFRLNLLNIVTTYAQRQSAMAWRPSPTTLRGRIHRFVTDRCRVATGRKVLHIRMEDLARLVGDSRLNVSRQLHQLESEGVVILRRSQIEFPAIEAFHGE